MKGKINNAIEFKIKIVPRATEICFSSAEMMGDIAAMALPPQIAVPQETRWEVFLSTPNNFPNKVPSIKVPKIEMTVKIRPSLPAFKALCTFIPKPKPTTEIFNNKLVAF